MPEEILQLKWWGWGDPHRTFDWKAHPYFRDYLWKRLPIPQRPVLLPPSIRQIHIAASRLPETMLKPLRRQLGGYQIAQDNFSRITHTYGKGYLDLLRIRKKHFPRVPDVVLYPENETDIQHILQWAVNNNVAIIPRGGGTSVVGGVEATSPGFKQPVAVVNLKRMDAIVELEVGARLVEAECGISGPQLEEALNREGFTLGHFPESFYHSTLGGWLATRSAGQCSTLYGRIEERVECVRVVTPIGILENRPVPATASGPPFQHIFLGSEGTLGIISRARLFLHPLPEHQFYTALLFPDFTSGVEAVQHFIQEGIRPAVVRLLDGEETDFFFAMRGRPHSGWKHWVQENALHWLNDHGWPAGQRSVLIVGLEGPEKQVHQQWKKLKALTRRYRAYHLGPSAGESWKAHRFDNPYLRDELLNFNVMVDTLETASEWNNFWPLYEAVRQAILNTYQRLGIPGLVMAHLSHVYPHGTSLYFILLALPHLDQEETEWWEIKSAASQAIIDHGGTISHHHGVGLIHRPWLRQEIGDRGIELLKQVKHHLDPKGVLNPGKLIGPEKES